jgi:hypothetical protein
LSTPRPETTQENRSDDLHIHSHIKREKKTNPLKILHIIFWYQGPVPIDLQKPYVSKFRL